MDDIPRYVARPLQGFLDYQKETMRLLHMSMGGIRMITSVPHSLEVLGEDRYSANPPGEPAKEEFLRELEQAKEQARFAENECHGGFPLLHSHALVGVWGAFESAIEDSVLGMLMNKPDLLQSECFSKIKISLAEFEILEKEDRIRYIFEETSRSHTLGRRQGVDRFEVLLGYVGLSGTVDPDIRKTVWEVSHIRSVIVHRASIADRKLVQSCPWLNYKIGERVKIPREVLAKYVHTLTEYLIVVLKRLCVKYDVDYERKAFGGEDRQAESAAPGSNEESE